MNTFTQLSKYCHYFVIMTIMSIMSFIAEDSFAKMAVKKVTTSTGPVMRDINGNRNSNSTTFTRVMCQGLPTYITTDENNQTQVYVYDGPDPASITEENIQSIATEEYRVEFDKWEDAYIIFGGEVGSETPVNPIIVMDNGKIWSLFLGGFHKEDTPHFIPRLTIKGGQVNFISVLSQQVTGQQFSTKGRMDIGFHDIPLDGAVINLSNMTYTGSNPISLYRNVMYVRKSDHEEFDEFDNYESLNDYERKYITDNVTLNVDSKSCTFLMPETDPNFDPEAQQHKHEYYISELIPDTRIVNSGEVTVACRTCSQTWPHIHFGVMGDSGPDRRSKTGYWYYVSEGKTIIPPTCQPGLTTYTLWLYFHSTAWENCLRYDFEGLIPPVEDVHDWGEDGICHHTHYQMQRDAIGNVVKDNSGNIVYECDANGNALIDETPQVAARNFVRRSVDKYYLDEEGNVLRNFVSQTISYRAWETEWFGTAKEALVKATETGDNQKVVGLVEDVELNEIDDVKTYNGLHFNHNNEGVIFELHGHTLSATNAAGGYYSLGLSEQPVTMHNGTVNAKLAGYGYGDVLLNNTDFYTDGISRENATLTLMNGSHIYTDASNEIRFNSIVKDEDSKCTYILSDDKPYTSNSRKMVDNLQYTRNCTESLVGKWQALMVPFSIEMTDEVLDQCDIAQLSIITENTDEGGQQANVAMLTKFALDETTPASTPLFIRPKMAGELSFEQNDVTLKSVDDRQIVSMPTATESYELHGVYDGTFTVPEDGSSYYAPYNGALTRFTGGLTHANRWYMKRENLLQGQSLAKSLVMHVFGEDNNDGINGIDFMEEVKTADGMIHSIDGRELTNDKQLQPGFYIKDHKKVLVK